MFSDVLLLFGVLSAAFGIVKTITLMFDRASPLFGITAVIIGVSSVGGAALLSEDGITPHDVPNALYRLIGTVI